jgi:hypothetical protein
MDARQSTESKRDRACWGLLRRREVWFPTLRAWFLVLLACAALLVLAIHTVHPFLATSHPARGGILVVEGWGPDYALQAAIAEMKQYRYGKLYVVGGPMERGTFLSEYKTFAELGAATLLRLGLDKESVQAVPAPPVRRDRTYANAVALKGWLAGHGPMPKVVNVISVGPHSRRTWLLFQKTFGDEVTVGVTAVPDQEYDPRRWWKSSQGVRSVIGETIAYCYARLLFSPSRQ